MEALVSAGLGLDYDTLRLGRTTQEWLRAGRDLRARVAVVLDGAVADVETIGSSSVLAMSAKPIIDLAVGLGPDQSLSPVTARLEAEGWIYRGDAGDDGGHVFVLETRPWHRVAHLHVVVHNGTQWRNYLRFRDLLRNDHHARARYEAVKLNLSAHSADRRSYATGKSAIVDALLREGP